MRDLAKARLGSFASVVATFTPSEIYATEYRLILTIVDSDEKTNRTSFKIQVYDLDYSLQFEFSGELEGIIGAKW